MRNTILILILSTFISCGIPEEKYDELKGQYDKLLIENNQNLNELDECMNGEERTIALVESSFKEKNYKSTKEQIANLKSNHPQSAKNKEYELLSKKIEKLELEEQREREEEAKEKKRLANLNNTGIWRINRYVDDFGESTKDGYITTRLKGKFSNSATQNSDLDIKFLISNSNDVDFMLYEYARNNPVKAYSTTKYIVRVKDKDGKKYTLYANNHSDRLSFGPSNSRTVHSILKKGGQIKFSVAEYDNQITNYEFTISNADYYDNAYTKLNEK